MENELERNLKALNEAGLYSTDKKDLAKDLVTAHIKVETEKYKIDKMIENNLVKETTFDQHYKRAVTDKLIEIFGNSKARMIYIATLTFIFALFNSSKFWEYTIGK